MNDKLTIGLIYGSVREGRFCDTVARWVEEQVTRYESFSLETIDLLGVDLPYRMESGDNQPLANLHRRLDQVDAIIVVVPEYNHSFPAPLKAFIDSAFHEWQAKPVAFVSYGGISGGLRAVEQLRQVFAELHAMTVRDSVSFASVWERFNERGELLEPERTEKSMRQLLTRLHWWGSALKRARQVSPYNKAVL